MHITIITIGSRGDIQPYIALGQGLRRRGHTVRLATHPEYRDFIVGRGLEFAPVEGNPKTILEGESGQAWLETGQDIFRFVRRMVDLVGPILRCILDDAWRGCQGTDAIIFSMLSLSGYHIAEKLSVPCYGAWLQPMSRTRAFPGVIMPAWLRSGGAFNWLTHIAVEQLIWQPFRRIINQWRQETLALPPLPVGGPYGRPEWRRMPVLYGYSPAVLPKPADWPAWVEVTGYWFLEQSEAWRPPADLVDFLAAGPPPVCIGFGSMTSREPDRLTGIALAALQQTGRRGILLSGWGGVGRSQPCPGSDHVFVIDAVPHAWLFPQTAAVVHHGGAGTTAAGLRAGVPTVVIPFFADQPFWGRRVAALGVGPAPIPCQRLSVERLGEAIQRATGDLAMQRQAAALGRKIRAENGVARAVASFGDRGA